MNSKTYVIGDIHGAFKAMLQLFERARVSEKDRFIFLGDYVDGWSQSPEVIDFLIDLQQTHTCVFIKGNHDDLCYRWLKYKESNEMWLFHGGQQTVEAYNKVSNQKIQSHIAFFEELQNYHIDQDNRLYVHAGYTNLKGVHLEYFEKMCFWDRTLWELALATPETLSKSDINYPRRLKNYKEIFIGHTPLNRIQISEPFNRHNVWNVDTGAAYNQPLSMLCVETKTFVQSDPVHLLYPEENGRNISG